MIHWHVATIFYFDLQIWTSPLKLFALWMVTVDFTLALMVTIPLLPLTYLLEFMGWGWWWIYFRFRKPLYELLCTILQPHYTHYKDVRFSMAISLKPKLFNWDPPQRKKRPKNPIGHHQFGIYKRLRKRYGLLSEHTYKWKSTHGSEEAANPHNYPFTHPADQLTRQLTDDNLARLRELAMAWSDDEPDLDPREDWSEYWERNTTSWPTYIETMTMVTTKYGVPLDTCKRLLESIDVLELFNAEFEMKFGLMNRPGNDSTFGNAFIAAADLLKELRYERAPGSKFEGAYIADHVNKCDVPIVFDTGCSFSVTPFLDDFKTPVEETEVKDLTGIKESVLVHGVGWVEWPIRDVFGQIAVVRTQAYYVPDASIRLHSPQSYFNEHQAGSCTFDHRKLIFETVDGSKLHFPFHPKSNIPLMFLDYGICQAGLTSHQIYSMTTNDKLEEQLLGILEESNYNLSKPQKELLLWHQRLGHAGQGWVQDLMFKVKNGIGDGAEPPVIKPMIQGAARCTHPKCAACQMENNTGGHQTPAPQD